MEESWSVLDSRNQESISWLKVLDPQEEFLVLELFKKKIKKNSAIPILKELALPWDTGQARAPCEPPVEARHVFGLRSNFLYYCRGAAAMADGLGIGSLGDQIRLGFRPYGVQTTWGSDPLGDWTTWQIRCIWGLDHLGDHMQLGIGSTGDWIHLGIWSPGDLHIYDLCTGMPLDFICIKLYFAYMSWSIIYGLY